MRFFLPWAALFIYSWKIWSSVYHLIIVCEWHFEQATAWKAFYIIISVRDSKYLSLNKMMTNATMKASHVATSSSHVSSYYIIILIKEMLLINNFFDAMWKLWNFYFDHSSWARIMLKHLRTLSFWYMRNAIFSY
jgi:hypothetical protein